MAQAYKKDIIVVETTYDWRAGEDFGGKRNSFLKHPMASEISS
jgi:arabinogalactan endo-1,4-beta-galactosidase